jgi:hypothetical protein
VSDHWDYDEYTDLNEVKRLMANAQEDNVVEAVEGTVVWSGGKDFGQYTLYSIRLEEFDKFWRCGRIDPKVKKGDYVSFNFVHTEKGGYVDIDSLQTKKMEVSEAAAKNPSVARKSKKPATKAEKDTYWSDKAKVDAQRQVQISFQAAWNTAIEFCKLAKELDALRPVGAKKDDKFDNLFGIVEDTAQKLWRKYLASADGPDEASAEVEKALDKNQESGSVDPKTFE